MSPATKILIEDLARMDLEVLGKVSESTLKYAKRRKLLYVVEQFKKSYKQINTL